MRQDAASREITELRQQQDRLLNLRLLEEIDADTFASKATELRDRIAQASLQLEAADRDRGEQAELAEKVFELSQALVDKWLVADYSAKRQLLEIVFLNFKLDDVTLCYELRKPFDVLAEGLVASNTRWSKIQTNQRGTIAQHRTCDLQALDSRRAHDLVIYWKDCTAQDVKPLDLRRRGLGVPHHRAGRARELLAPVR